MPKHQASLISFSEDNIQGAKIKRINNLKRNIYLFYTGGLKRETHIINYLIYKFNKIYLITIDTDISKIKINQNIIIKKLF